MKKLLFRVAGILAALGAPLLISTAAHAVADTCTWTGGGADSNFSTAANWSICDNGAVPEPGDTLNFPANVTNRTPQNDFMVGTSFQAITFNGAASVDSNYTIDGNALSLVGGINDSMTRSSSENINKTFLLDIVLLASQAFTSSDSYMTVSNLDLSTYAVSINRTNVIGSITGSGTLTSSGSVTLSGDNSTFSGPISVISGTLTTRSATALGSAAGGTTVAEASFLSFCSVTSNITIAEPLTLTGTPGDSTIYATPGSCGSNFSLPTTNTKLTLSGPVTLNSDVQFNPYGTDLIISGTYTSNGHAFTVAAGAAGTLTLPTGVVGSAPVTITYADNSPGTAINVGYNTTATVTGAYGSVFINQGGILKGTGTVGAITLMGGTLAPGLSPGCLNTGNLELSDGTYQVELADLTACTEYDQTKVTGTVTLGGTLQIVRYNNMVPRLNNSFIIISNDGTDAVTGDFANVAAGATIVADGITYTLSKTGGDGNDVVLVVTAVDSALGAPNTGAHIIKSGIILPIFAIMSAIGIIGMNFVATKRK